MSDWCARCGNHMGDSSACHYCANEEPPIHEPALPLSVKYEQLQARCDEQQGIIERLRETITIRGQRLAVLSGDNVRLESEKAELEAKAEDLEAELIFENNTTKMQKKLVQQLEAEKARQQDRIATLREGLNQAIELLVTALHEPEQITEGEIHDLRTMEIEAREPTPHPAESENSNG